MSVPILHILGTAQPEGTGIARIVSALATGLDPAKYQVHAWFLGPEGPLIEDLRAAGAPVRLVNWQHGVLDPAGAYRFWRWLRKNDFAVVHQHSGARSIRHLVSLSSRARLVVHLHGKISPSGSSHDTPIATRGADAIIAASHSIANQIPDLKSVVIHAGVELLLHLEDRPQRPDIVIGTACRLVSPKGVADLIRAVGILRPDFPQVRLEIAGTGLARTELEAEASRLGLLNHVHFLGWQRDLGPTFRSWDIFAMPSLDEGFGMAALEAMAEGLPVVATSVGGLSEIVDDSRTGYLVPPSDVTSLAERLRRLILDREHRQAMGAAGRERARDHFSATRMIAETAAIYDSLINK